MAALLQSSKSNESVSEPIVGQKEAEQIAQKLSQQEGVLEDILKDLNNYEPKLGHIVLLKCDPDNSLV